MKKLLLILILFCLANSVKSQITLEHSYPTNGGSQSTFAFIRIDSNEFRYVYVDYQNSSFTLYHLNHSVDQTITIPVPYQWGVSQYSITNISRTLFDCDSNNVEYLLSYICNPQPCTTGGYVDVIREDGTTIFHADSAQATSVIGGVSSYISAPVYQTPVGAKMRLWYQGSYDIKIFSLCGTLFPPLSIDENEENSLGSSYPNPTLSLITIPYKLPTGNEFGVISLYDLSGKKIREYKVDNKFDNLRVDLSELSSGTFYYQLTTSAGTSKMKKIIKH